MLHGWYIYIKIEEVLWDYKDRAINSADTPERQVAIQCGQNKKIDYYK